MILSANGRRTVAACVLQLLLSGGAAAQVVRTPEGTVEFVGLKRWTVEMIRDSMAVKAPGVPLGQCAAILTQLGFPSATSDQYVDERGEEYAVVSVVEPEDSARISFRPEPRDSSAERRGWEAGTRMIHTRPRGFQAAVRGYAAYRAGDSAGVRTELRRAGRDSADVPKLWAFLDRHRSEADERRAMRVVAHDANVANRVVAETILGNFDGNDRVWWTLIDLQRSRSAAVAATAGQVLASMAQRSRRSVPWGPAAPAIRSLLAGTNVYLFTPTLGLLRATAITPALAKPIVGGGNGELLLAHLAAHQPHVRDAAHVFLVQLAGTDLGYDVDAW